MRILVKEQGSLISDLVFGRKPIEIGSQSKCGVHLPDMRVHSNHARLFPEEGGGWTVEHLAGAAKTIVNGHVLRDTLKVFNGDQITIEDYTLNVYFNLSEEDRAAQQKKTKVSTVEVAPKLPLPRGAVVHSSGSAMVMTPDQLNNLSRFAVGLGACDDIPAVMECVLDECLQRFAGRAAWIGVRRLAGGPLDLIQGRDFKGKVFDRPKLYDNLWNRAMQHGGSVWIPKFEDDDTASIIVAPLISSTGRLGFVYLDSKKTSQNFTERDFEDLIALTNVVSSKLGVVIQGQVRQHKAVTSAESSIVQAIQSKLDPQALPEWPELNVAAHARSGQTRVGDSYDIMRLPNGAAGFFVGHVSAPPVTAAIAMIETRTAFRIAVLHADMPHVMMQELNWLLCSRQEKVYMQCAIVLVDPKTGALLHCISGPSCAVVIGQSGHARRLQSVDSPLLGTQPDHRFTTRKGLLGANESLVMYTAGVTKLRDQAGRELDEDRFMEMLCDGFGMTARKALDETLADLTLYCERGYQPEDLTILLAHRAERTLGEN